MASVYSTDSIFAVRYKNRIKELVQLKLSAAENACSDKSCIYDIYIYLLFLFINQKWLRVTE